MPGKRHRRDSTSASEGEKTSGTTGERPSASTSGPLRKRNRRRGKDTKDAARTFGRRLISQELEEKYDMERMHALTEPVARRLITTVRSRVDGSITNAMMQGYKIPGLNYRKWARARDADEKTFTHSAKNPPGPLVIPDDCKPAETALLYGPHGLSLEDGLTTSNPAAAAMLFRDLYDEEIHELCIQAGTKLSENFYFKKDKYRPNYREGLSIFHDGQVHICQWQALGQEHRRPVVSTDAKDPRNAPAIKEFFANPGIQAVLHGVNMILERLDPEYTDSLKELKEHTFTRKHGGILRENPCHMGGLGMHFNQDGSSHVDKKSLHSGWDIIIGFGRYSNCEFRMEQLNVAIDFRPLDVLFGRGAGITHVAEKWEGPGRMVLVPFTERRLFPGAAIGRPEQFRMFYGEHFKDLRKKFPAVPISSLKSPTS